VRVCVCSADKVHSQLMSKCILVVSVDMNFNTCGAGPSGRTSARLSRDPCGRSRRAGNACAIRVFAYGRPRAGEWERGWVLVIPCDFRLVNKQKIGPEREMGGRFSRREVVPQSVGSRDNPYRYPPAVGMCQMYYVHHRDTQCRDIDTIYGRDR